LSSGESEESRNKYILEVEELWDDILLDIEKIKKSELLSEVEKMTNQYFLIEALLAIKNGFENDLNNHDRSKYLKEELRVFDKIRNNDLTKW
jgi:hypothetical protein